MDNYENSLSDEEIDLSSLMCKPKDEKKDQKKSNKLPDEKMDEKLKEKISKKSKTKQKLSEEDIINKRRLILLIEFYLLEFGDKLKAFKKINVEKKTYEELEDIKKEMDFTLSNRSNIRQGTQLVVTSIQTLEFLCVNFTPIKCEGLSKICDDPETIEDIKHILLKRMHLIQSEPEHRLIYKVISNMLLLHNFNSYKEAINSNIKVNEGEVENINKKFEDL